MNNNSLQKIFFLRTAVLSISLGLLTACDQRDESVSFTGEPETVRLGIAMQPSSALTMIALEQRYFSDEGLNVEVTEYPSGRRALNEGLFGGREDFVTTADMPVAIAGLQQRNFRIGASAFQADNVNRIIARRDAGIEQAADLAGKKVATQEASAVHYFLHLFLLGQGLSESDIELSFFRAEELSEALLDGRIDAFSMREPYISIASEALGENAVIFEAPGIYPQIDLILISDNMAVQRPSTINKITRALLRAERFIEDNTTQAIAITARWLGSEETEVASFWPTVGLSVELEQSMLLLLENQARWAIRQEVVDQTSVPNYAEYIYSDALDELNSETVRIFN